MGAISVREPRSQPAAVWRALAEERHLAVTTNGKPMVLLSAPSPEILDETLAAIATSRGVAGGRIDATERAFARLTAVVASMEDDV